MQSELDEAQTPNGTVPIARRMNDVFGGRPEQAFAICWCMAVYLLNDLVDVSSAPTTWRVTASLAAIAPLAVLVVRDLVDQRHARRARAWLERAALPAASDGPMTERPCARVVVVGERPSRRRLFMVVERAPQTLRVKCWWSPTWGALLTIVNLLYLVFDLDRFVSTATFVAAIYGATALVLAARYASAVRYTLDPGCLEIVCDRAKQVIDLTGSRMVVDLENGVIIVADADGRETCLDTAALVRPVRFAATLIRCAKVADGRLHPGG